jgi:hypothetical protein
MDRENFVYQMAQTTLVLLNTTNTVVKGGTGIMTAESMKDNSETA